MWLPDLSNIYYGTFSVKNAQTGDHFNIGWLSHQHAFPKGDVDVAVINRLKEYPLVNKCMGFHRCEMCETDERVFGNGEIHVVTDDGAEFRSPEMIIHYIEVHNYLPPQPFLDAVSGCSVTEYDVTQYILYHHAQNQINK